MTPPTRVALVTGGSRGIGAAVAKRLAAGGFHVVVNFRSQAEAAESVVAEIARAGGSAEAQRADVTDRDAVRSLLRTIGTAHKRLDVLVNNAGRSEDGLLVLTPDEQWWSVLRDNLAPVVNCSRAALTLMMKNGGGSIVNISSVSGLRGVEGQTAYAAAKAAIIGFTRALAREVSGKGVLVNCVAPGPIETDMYAHVSESRRSAGLAAMPLHRLGRAEEVAEVVGMLADGRAGFIVGQVISIDGGITA